MVQSKPYKWLRPSELVGNKTFKSIFTVILFLILGHTFGSYYLDLWGRRQLVDGLYISQLSPNDKYASIDWDELVYFPRALAVAQGYSPLDPWVHHDDATAGWGLFPLVPPLIFGGITRLAGDLHIALYLAVIISTVLQGWILMLFFQTCPLQLGLWEALIASLWFIKFPWFAVRFLQFPSVSLPSDYTFRRFINGAPVDAFLTIEAGLFTYFPYLVFLVLFWRLMNDKGCAIFTGIFAGLLTYVYFYHQIFAFLLLSTAAIIALIAEGWNKCKPYLVALMSGLLCAIPHFVQLGLLRKHVDLFQYIQRLGFEDGRFSVQNLLQLWYLPGLLFIGAIYGIVRRPAGHKSLCLRALSIIVISYVIVLNLRVVLGFDMNSDHYWRQSLGLPATLWMIVATADLMKDLSNRNTLLKRGMPVAAGILGVVILTAAIKNTWRHRTWGLEHYEKRTVYLREHISDAQKDMVRRMQLLKRVLQPDEVLLVADPATAYHSVINLRARLFVPSGMSILSNREILERYFVAQYFSGSQEIKGPRDSGRLREPGTFVPAVGEHLFLFVNYTAKHAGPFGLDDEMTRMIQDVSVKDSERIYARRMWRVDLIFGHAVHRAVALERIRKYFRVLELRDAGGYWVVRVERKTEVQS